MSCTRGITEAKVVLEISDGCVKLRSLAEELTAQIIEQRLISHGINITEELEPGPGKAVVYFRVSAFGESDRCSYYMDLKIVDAAKVSRPLPGLDFSDSTWLESREGTCRNSELPVRARECLNQLLDNLTKSCTAEKSDESRI